MPPRQTPRRRGLRWLLWITVLILVLAAIPWYRERPLRNAERLLDDDRLQDALRIIDAYLKDDPNNSRGIALKARVLVAMGDARGAIRLIDRVGAATPDEMRAYAEASLILERWTTALPILEHLVKLSPDDADLLHELSACRARLGRYEEAVQAAEKFCTTPGNAARGYVLIGMLEHERGNNQKCCDAWKRVLEIQPDAENLQVTAADFFLDYGQSLLQISDFGLAEKMLSRSVEIEPRAKALAPLGEARFRAGRNDQAELAWKKAIELDAKNHVAREGLAETAMQQGQFEAALEWLQPLAADEDINSTTAYLLHRTYTLLKDTENSSRWKEQFTTLQKQEERRWSLERVIATSPTSMWGEVFQAYLLAEQNNPSQAAVLLLPYISDQAPEFIRKLWAAVQNGTPLPSIDEAPINSL